MKKAFEFINSLKPNFFELFGYPTIKVFSDYTEVYFDTNSTIRDLKCLDLSADEFRLFVNSDCLLTVCFTFYNDNV